jgi:hypothetical protein
MQADDDNEDDDGLGMAARRLWPREVGTMPDGEEDARGLGKDRA